MVVAKPKLYLLDFRNATKSNPPMIAPIVTQME